MFIVRNKKTGLYISNISGSWNRRRLNHSRGYGPDPWTDNINDAKVFPTRGGIKTSIGVAVRDSDGEYVTKFVSNQGRRIRTYERKLPDWAEILEIGLEVKTS